MKLRKLSITLLAAMLALLSTGLASAQTNAYATAFTTSITYSNVGAASANITLTYYAENSGTAISTTLPALAAGASSSVFVGNVTQVNAGFKGSGVLSSDQPIVATLVQLPASTSTVKNRPLSNGFAAGATKVLLATTLKNKFNSTTVFSVQNADSAPVNLTIKFYNADNPSAAAIQVTQNAVPAGSTKYFDLGTMTQIPSGFNGSATIEATGNVVATAMELSTTGNAASAFEGVTSGATKLYMPSALCNAFGGQNSFYAIQNTATSGSASVTVNFSSGKSVNKTIAAGAKASVAGCDGGNSAGFSGSASISSTGGDIVAIGKVSGLGISSAFLGATAGASKLAAPYVRWSETQFSTGARQRAFIAIQNIGTADLAAGSVKVRYIDRNGVTVGTHTINTAVAVGAKVNSNPFVLGAAGAEFGYSGSQFGGGAIIEGPSGSQLVAVVRVVSFVPATGETVGEDYNGIAIQ
jgi:hypothetical protein